MMRKVQYRKLSLEINSHFVSRLCCCMCCMEVTNQYPFTIDGDPRLPPSQSSIPINSDVPGSVALAITYIREILTKGGLSKIRPTIIKATTIDMVRVVIEFYRSAQQSFENNAVHLYCFLFLSSYSFLPCCVVVSFIFGRRPIPLYDEIVIYFLDNRTQVLAKENESAVNVIDSERSLYMRLLISISALPALFRFFGHRCTTDWARNISARPFLLFFGRISSWLGSQLSLVHVSPLREMCGLATLVLL